MGTHPQTLYGIADSPVGLAAWMLDHDVVSYALIARVFDGQTEGLTRDDILDNITHYWLTNTGVSSRSSLLGGHHRSKQAGFFDVKGVSIPVAVSVFPDESMPSSAELGRTGLSQAHSLQQGSQGRPLCGLGTAATLLRRSSQRASDRCAS